MTHREVAMEYLRCVCASDLEGLVRVLFPDLQFSRPFHDAYSRTDSLESLKHDPPEKCAYQVVSVTEDNDRVAMFYHDEKADKVIPIAQLFKMTHQIIRPLGLISAKNDVSVLCA
jgi:hypothetical protein